MMSGHGTVSQGSRGSAEMKGLRNRASAMLGEIGHNRDSTTGGGNTYFR